MFKIYLPHRGSVPVARCLHDDDLDEQVLAVENLLEVLRQASPSSKLLAERMFRGYDMFLLTHLWQLSCEARRRGVHPPAHGPEDDPYLRQHAKFLHLGISTTPRVPRWYGAEWLHESHRSQLVLKRPEHYTWQFPRTPLMMPYLYPQNLPGRFEFSVTVSLTDQRHLKEGTRMIPSVLLRQSRHLREVFS